MPVIVVSGAPRAYEIARAMRTATMLFKPIGSDELIRAVRLFTARGREGEAAN